MTTRKALLATLAGGAFATIAQSPSFAENDRAATADIDLLNFVLNLEYLKADFYGYAVFGKGLDESNDIDTSGVGSSGATVGGAIVPLRGKMLAKTAHQLAHDGRVHVILLRTMLGRDAIAKPLIDLGGFGGGARNLKDFLLIARTLEDVAVSAYAGIVPLVQSKETLATATRLLAAEAQHAGNIRLLCGLKGIVGKSFDSKDVVPPPAGTDVFSLDKSALATTRTPGEALAILKPFFPRGVNGALK